MVSYTFTYCGQCQYDKTVLGNLIRHNKVNIKDFRFYCDQLEYSLLASVILPDTRCTNIKYCFIVMSGIFYNSLCMSKVYH